MRAAGASGSYQTPQEWRPGVGVALTSRAAPSCPAAAATRRRLAVDTTRRTARPHWPRLGANTSTAAGGGAGGGAIANLASKFTQNSGKVTLINDTISGNSATGAGGGIFNTNTTASEFKV
jgi:hypothetical protein